jgi:hypothetical protein
MSEEVHEEGVMPPTDETLNAEIERLRAENERLKEERDNPAEPEPEGPKEPEPTHQLLLANGETVLSAGTSTHWGEDNIPVVASTPLAQGR